MENLDRDRPDIRFSRFWFIEGRLAAAFAIGAVPAAVVYNLTGRPIVSVVTLGLYSRLEC
jgi:hypothetical protein